MTEKVCAANKTFLLIVAAIIALANFASAAETVDLKGEWRFALDRTDAGVKENWFAKDLNDKINLPGALQSQNYGDDISTKTPWVLSLYDRFWFERADYKDYIEPGNVKVPFLSQPPKHYLGAAWYQKEFEIAENWRGKRIVLFLERPHWESTVWIDDQKIGSNLSLVAPHEYDLGMLAPGKHRVSIRVDNQMLLNYRPDAHSVSDSLGMSWNGVVGKIELRATSPVWIDDAQIFTAQSEPGAVATGSTAANTKNLAEVKVKIGNSSGKAGNGSLIANGKQFPVSWDANGGNHDIEIQLPANAQTWDEFNPVLHKLDLRLSGENADDSRQISFGLTDFRADGNKFLLNGKTVYFRGNHHGGDFPLTGFPPTDVEYWRKIFQINKDWGINHVRFHSFCPPEAAFVAADELGIYLQPEPGMWNEISPGTPVEKQLYEETDRMIRAYGNHPSFLLLSPSNEPKGRWKESLDQWIAHYREVDPRRLYTNGTGHTEREVPGLAENTDYLAMQRIGSKMLRGNSAWFGRDYGKSLEDVNIPVVSHELGQWVSYPDFDIIKKFTGYMRAGNYEIFRDSMQRKGLLARNKDFALASGKFQLECYKEEIEANLRTPGMYGFQLLDLHDYLGQGTALVGLLDAFWQEKGYATAKEFRRFNSETVPLARLTKRVFTTNDEFAVDTEIAHFGAQEIKNAQPFWKIVDANGKTVASGNLQKNGSEPPAVAGGLIVANPPATAGSSDFTIPIGKNIGLGKITVDLSKLPAPNAYKLIVGLKNTAVENDWNFWLYPAQVETANPKNVLITDSWQTAEIALAKGGKVLYSPKKANLDWTNPPLDDVPVFWTRFMNPAWSRMLGLWIDKNHQALNGFPTENYFDWQWTETVKNARAVNLDKLPVSLQPIVQPIDDWNRNYKLGLIFEARVGKGKLLVSAIDLETDLTERAVARQLRKSLLDYAASDKFNPRVAIAPEQIRALFFDTRVMQKLNATAKATGDAANAVDGDPNTFWIAGTQKDSARQNQEIVVSFPAAVSFSGLMIMPRQNHREHEGDIREYILQTSDEGTNWQELKRGALISTFEPQRISFDKNIAAKHLKIISLSGFGTDKTTALAEIAVIYQGAKLTDDNGDIEYQRSKAASPDIDEGTPNDNRKRKPKP